MATISFADARDMATDSQAWLKAVSDFIKDPNTSPAPEDIYDVQKLAFEIDITELRSVIDNSARLIGVFGKEKGGSYSVVLVGTDADLKPSDSVRPIETFPIRANMTQLNTVLNDYLTP